VWVHPGSVPPIVEPEPVIFRQLNLYCWPCKAVHALPLVDVEKVVYALGAMEADGYQMAKDDPAMASAMAEDDAPTCLTTVLTFAHSDLAAHVEQGAACREAS
jgi:hypothetical protein